MDPAPPQPRGLEPGAHATTLVIPCFNEEARLPPAQVAELLADPRVAVVFVDDGSSDGTAALLARLCEDHPGRAAALSLPTNQGKAAAVRAGLLAALDGAPRGHAPWAVGYLDADFATPPGELHRLLDEMIAHDASVAMGARVARLGAQIERHPTRHYLGRVFASLASIALSLPVYDTQCGAKLFRATPALERALSSPFTSRWIFDVELLGRLTRGPDALGRDAFYEMPLRVWHDVAGSKLRAKAMLRAGGELLRLGARWRRPGS